jgi:hypothetical protein
MLVLFYKGELNSIPYSPRNVDKKRLNEPQGTEFRNELQNIISFPAR